MRTSAWASGVSAVAVALSLAVAACGSSSDEGNNGSNKPAANTQSNGTTPTEGAKPGGKLSVLWAGDVDHIDCGQTYYQMGYFICFSTQRPLYSYKPDDSEHIVPDLAT